MNGSRQGLTDELILLNSIGSARGFEPLFIGGQAEFTLEVEKLFIPLVNLEPCGRHPIIFPQPAGPIARQGSVRAQAWASAA